MRSWPLQTAAAPFAFPSGWWRTLAPRYASHPRTHLSSKFMQSFPLRSMRSGRRTGLSAIHFKSRVLFRQQCVWLAMGRRSSLEAKLRPLESYNCAVVHGEHSLWKWLRVNWASSNCRPCLGGSTHLRSLLQMECISPRSHQVPGKWVRSRSSAWSRPRRSVALFVPRAGSQSEGSS